MVTGTAGLAQTRASPREAVTFVAINSIHFHQLIIKDLFSFVTIDPKMLSAWLISLNTKVAAVGLSQS